MGQSQFARVFHDATGQPPHRYLVGLRIERARELLERTELPVRVDPRSYDPGGAPELVDSGTMADDFCIDEDAGVAYVATHRENTIDRVPLEPGDGRRSVAGQPLDELLLGPSSVAWSRAAGEHGRVAYATPEDERRVHDGIMARLRTRLSIGA